MANLTKVTRDHDEIRRWAEERGGKPAHVKNTGSGDDIGILRIDFPGYTGEGTLEPISWEEFFKKFDERNLALVYQEETAGGQKSNFNKLVSADSVDAAGAGGRQGRSGATRSRSRAPKKAAASSSTRSSARPKSATKASGKKASSKNAASRKGGAQKSSGKAAAKKKSSGKKASKKQPGSRKAVKKSAARRRR